ncbi:hypothetical protein RJ639_040162, partial [Escallonia herrerae]
MMGTSHGTSEIVEFAKELDHGSHSSKIAGKDNMVKHGQKYTIEDDINRLFEAIDIRSSRGVGSQVTGDHLHKKSMKRPIRVGSSQASGIGVSECVSLKQALRGLCISQASEMAATKRLCKPSGLLAVSEAEAIKRLYRSVVVEATASCNPLNEGKLNFVEISLVAEQSEPSLSEKIDEFQEVQKMEPLNQSAISSTPLACGLTGKTKKGRTLPQADTAPPSSVVGSDFSCVDLGQREKLSLAHSSSAICGSNKLLRVDEIFPASGEVLVESVPQDKEQRDKFHSAATLSSSKTGCVAVKSASGSARLFKPVFRKRNFVEKKTGQDSASDNSTSNQCYGRVDSDLAPSIGKMVCHTPNRYLNCGDKQKEKEYPASSGSDVGNEASSLRSMDSTTDKLGCKSKLSSSKRVVVRKAIESSRSREKGEFSQSSKSSAGEYSSSTSYSEESILSGYSRSGSRPHMSKDLRWEAINSVQKQHGSLGLRHFKLLKKLGGGDIGTVYLAELTGTNCLFALKVMDNEFLAVRKKMLRAQTEREILQMLDHPFLPTLFAHFKTERYSCLIMEYCPGGDLHVLRQRQPSKSFSEQAARFYVSEVLLALEYLHMLGVVYRDLKPENILVREDGHIMLSDFDLSLKCAANSALLKPSSPIVEPTKRVSSPCSENSCIEPFCLHPSWQVPCFTPRLPSIGAKTRKVKADLVAQVRPLPQLVVEPTTARSNSYVGTHEYLAPEIIKGEGHGSPVDWWTFGIFLYELLYGKTPFKGAGNEDTLTNVASQCLVFPESPIVSSHARDLIRRLLKKEPNNRLGSVKGAADIKQHPFFEGLNWALIRCAKPPELPKICDLGSLASDLSSLIKDNNDECQKEPKSTGEHLEFEIAQQRPAPNASHVQSPAKLSVDAPK